MKTEFTRRKFLQTSTVAAAAGLTAPWWLARARAASGPAEDPTVVATPNAPAGPGAWSGHDTPELIAAALENLPAPPPGPFAESWDSIGRNYKDPDWFRDG